MTDQTPAETLRAAAFKLRQATDADYLTPGPWLSLADGDRLVRDTGPGLDPIEYVVPEPMDNPSNAEYIALMHPGVGAALAAWLDREAAIWDEMETLKAELHPKGFKLSWGVSTHAEALTVARAILGSPQ